MALAGARVRQGDLAAATRAYREAARRAPQEEQPQIASRLGWLNKEMGNAGAAQRYFGRARVGVFTPLMTYGILGLTVFVSLFVEFGPTGNQLGNLLALDKERVIAGEYWRLLTVTLVHGGLLHLALNMYALWIVGPIVEALYGRARFLAFYLHRRRGRLHRAAICSSPSRRSVPAARSSASSGCCLWPTGSTSRRWAGRRDR